MLIAWNALSSATRVGTTFIEKSNDNFVGKWSRTPRRTRNSNTSRDGIDRTTTTLNSTLKHEHHTHHSSVAQNVRVSRTEHVNALSSSRSAPLDHVIRASSCTSLRLDYPAAIQVLHVPPAAVKSNLGYDRSLSALRLDVQSFLQWFDRHGLKSASPQLVPSTALRDDGWHQVSRISGTMVLSRYAELKCPSHFTHALGDISLLC